MTSNLFVSCESLEKTLKKHGLEFAVIGDIYIERNADGLIQEASIETVVGAFDGQGGSHCKLAIKFSLCPTDTSSVPQARAAIELHVEEEGLTDQQSVNLSGNKEAELAVLQAELEDWYGCEHLIDACVSAMAQCFDLFSALGEQVVASSLSPSPAVLPIIEYSANVFTEACVGVMPFVAVSPQFAAKVAGDLCFHQEIAGRGNSHPAQELGSQEALITKAGAWTEGAPTGVFLDPLEAGEINYSLTMTFDGFGVMDMDCLKKLWKAFGDCPVNRMDKIKEAFLHFPAGTDRFEVWAWFEQSNPGFHVALAHGFPTTVFSLVTGHLSVGEETYDVVAAIKHLSSLSKHDAAKRLLAEGWPCQAAAFEVDGKDTYNIVEITHEQFTALTSSRVREYDFT